MDRDPASGAAAERDEVAEAEALELYRRNRFREVAEGDRPEGGRFLSMDELRGLASEREETGTG